MIGRPTKCQANHAASPRTGHGAVMMERHGCHAAVDSHFVNGGAQIGGAVHQGAIQVKQDSMHIFKFHFKGSEGLGLRGAYEWPSNN